VGIEGEEAMTRNDSLGISIDTTDFCPVSAVDQDARTFSVRAAEVRAQARRAMEAEAARILAEARDRIREQQLERIAEIDRVRAENRSDGRKTALLLVASSIALVLWGVWAAGQHGGTDPVQPVAHSTR
jgi:hypothetical protein